MEKSLPADPVAEGSRGADRGPRDNPQIKEALQVAETQDPGGDAAPAPRPSPAHWPQHPGPQDIWLTDLLFGASGEEGAGGGGSFVLFVLCWSLLPEPHWLAGHAI